MSKLRDELIKIIYEEYRLAWSKGEYPDGIEVSSKIVADKVMSLLLAELPEEEYVYEMALDKGMHPQMAYGMGWRGYRQALLKKLEG